MKEEKTKNLLGWAVFLLLIVVALLYIFGSPFAGEWTEEPDKAGCMDKAERRLGVECQRYVEDIPTHSIQSFSCGKLDNGITYHVVSQVVTSKETGREYCKLKIEQSEYFPTEGPGVSE